ncbi:MAG: hypothetical protein FWD26_05290 [Treponema sp.]|nr:hypothetical protein [Treponema sp.]
MKCKSDILEMIHENASENYKIGAISEARMREYDEMCLVKTPEPVYETNNSVQFDPARGANTPVTA